MTGAGGLVLRGVAATPGGADVLSGVDLEVAAGTCTAVLGPSGAGKTTLLRVVAGLEPAATGTITAGGRELTGLPAHRRRVGVVFQEPRLFPHRTVRDNVAFGLEVAGVSAANRRDRATALLDRVGLAGLGDRTVEGLSGGEQQRINLARALAVDPDVLLLDEPLSSVDPERRDGLLAVIAEATAGLTRVHVTHDRAEAAEVGDRVAVLLGGRIVQHAPPRELFDHPHDAEVARMLGASVLTGQVEDGRLLLPAGPVAIGGPDGPATVAVRPEAVRLGSGPLRATVTAATYRGTTVRVTLDLGDGTELRADVGPHAAPGAGATIDLDLTHLHRLAPGDHR